MPEIMLMEHPVLFRTCPRRTTRYELTPASAAQLCSILVACRVRLRRARAQPRRPSTELETLRWRMAKTWSATMGALDGCRGSSVYAAGRRAWMALREPLEVAKYAGGAAPERDGAPGLEVCAWDECECCYHRPVHPMRVCTGCYVVAYCNAHCQAK